jgi:hypothetical protein
MTPHQDADRTRIWRKRPFAMFAFFAIKSVIKNKDDLSHCADADDRGAANCAVRGYSVIGSCATTLGVLATAFPDFAAVSTGCTRAVAMQLMFGLFAVLGLVTFPCIRLSTM